VERSPFLSFLEILKTSAALAAKGFSVNQARIF
jgi:hypothetical protein